MDAIVTKITESLVSQGPIGLVLIGLWFLWIKPRTEADVKRVEIEGEASAKRMASDAESNKTMAMSLSRIADAIDAMTQDSNAHNKELKRIVCYTVQGLRGQLEHKDNETREALTALQAIVKE